MGKKGRRGNEKKEKKKGYSSVGRSFAAERNQRHTQLGTRKKARMENPKGQGGQFFEPEKSKRELSKWSDTEK